MIALASLTLVLSGCSQTELGKGGSAVSGTAGAAGASGEASTLPHCARPLGTAALVEADPNALTLLNSVGLQSPTPLLRLMMAQSNCFQVVDRGAALSNIQTEQALRQGGMLQRNSVTAQGRMITVQYLLTPNVIFSNPNAGGASAGGLLGGFGLGGALAGAALGSMRVQEAQTALFLTDAQTGVQSAVAEGSARVRDFGGMGGLGGIGAGIAGFGAIGGYSSTSEGKLIAAALLDSYSKLVVQVQAQTPNLPTTMNDDAGGAARPAHRAGNATLVSAIQTELIRTGFYSGSPDGSLGPKTKAAISDFQKSKNLPVDGQPSPGLLSSLKGS
jgi:curli biogenesis system outer membrane secretion channel CsgG